MTVGSERRGEAMQKAIFHDKLGRTENFDIRPGETIRNILRERGIPMNSVITLINGKMASEALAIVEPGDFVEFRQVRNYDLGLTRRPPERLFSAVTPVYTKSVLFDDNGDLEAWSEQYDEAGFIRYVENTFVESICRDELIREGDRLVVGLSGGRDSVAFLKLLAQTQSRLPRFSMTAVTVTGLPDWEEPDTFGAARAACELLGIDQVIVPGDAIQQGFHLNRPYVDVMNHVLSGKSRSLVMVIGHQVLRRMIERVAVERGVDKIVLGLNGDDLVSSLLIWYTTGCRMGSIPLRSVGEFTYLFPLFRITKKELTMYLELTAVELNQQGAPGRFSTGPAERSLAYAVTDHLYDLWPGIDYYAFEAFATMQTYMMPKAERCCSNCGGTFLLQGNDDLMQSCDICQYFAREGFLASTATAALA